MSYIGHQSVSRAPFFVLVSRFYGAHPVHDTIPRTVCFSHRIQGIQGNVRHGFLKSSMDADGYSVGASPLRDIMFLQGGPAKLSSANKADPEGGQSV